VKDKPTSPLFCIVAVLLFGTLTATVSYSQNTTDSTLLYYKTLLNPGQSNAVANAFTFYENKLATHLNNNNILEAVQALRIIAIGQIELGYLYESEATAVAGLSHLETLPNDSKTMEAQTGLYNHLGKVYRRLEDYKNALYQYNKALALSKNTNDSMLITNNIATTYIDKKDYQRALQELTKVYISNPKQSNNTHLATVLDNMGFVQSKLNNPEGLPNMRAALDMRLKAKNKRGVYASYKHLSQYYIALGDSALALSYAEKGYALAKTIKSAVFLKDALSNLLLLKQDSLTVNYLRLSDSISRAKLLQDNTYAAIRFDFEKEQKRAITSELLKEKERRKKQLAQAIGILVLLASIGVYFILRARHRKEKLEQLYNTETRISKKLHDEVANDVYHVMAQLQNKDTQQEQVLDDLEDIYNRTRDISKENSIIDLTEGFELSLSDFLRGYQNAETTIIAKNISKIDWDRISDIKKTTLYRVLQELLTNMKKHSQASLVAIVFSNNKNKLNVDYTDNGVGCDLKKQNGLLNTENRMKTINGTISFESKENNGFKATITI
jgi:signal transduction histidine kinase